jgi:hypothetical protein
MCVGRGRPKARPRTSSIGTGVTVCRSARAWRSRPGGGAWASTCAAVRATSTAWTSGRSSGTCFDTAAARSRSSGIGGVPIAVEKSKPSSPATHACVRTTSLPTRRSSTRRSLFGHRPTASWRTASLMTSSIFDTSLTLRCDAFDGPSLFSCRASTPPTCHGRVGERLSIYWASLNS